MKQVCTKDSKDIVRNVKLWFLFSQGLPLRHLDRGMLSFSMTPTYTDVAAINGITFSVICVNDQGQKHCPWEIWSQLHCVSDTPATLRGQLLLTLCKWHFSDTQRQLILTLCKWHFKDNFYLHCASDTSRTTFTYIVQVTLQGQLLLTLCKWHFKDYLDPQH